MIVRSTKRVLMWLYRERRFITGTGNSVTQEALMNVDEDEHKYLWRRYKGGRFFSFSFLRQVRA